MRLRLAASFRSPPQDPPMVTKPFFPERPRRASPSVGPPLPEKHAGASRTVFFGKDSEKHRRSGQNSPGRPVVGPRKGVVLSRRTGTVRSCRPLKRQGLWNRLVCTPSRKSRSHPVSGSPRSRDDRNLRSFDAPFFSLPPSRPPPEHPGRCSKQRDPSCQETRPPLPPLSCLPTAPSFLLPRIPASLKRLDRVPEKTF